MNAEQMIEHASEWKFKEDMHVNGGKEFVGRRLKCVQEPRITLISRYDRKLKTVHQTWQVDGIDQVSFAVALANVMSDEEKELGR